MSAVEMYVPLKLLPAVVHESVTRLMQSIGQRSAPYETLALSVNFHDLHISAIGEVHVPVETRIEHGASGWEYDLEIRAAAKERFFPKFVGTLTVMPAETETTIWLQGRYDLPLGPLGAAVDATVLRGAAKNSLCRFLQWFADEIKADVREREHRYELETRSMHD